MIATKLGAVSGRGAQKDYWDLAEWLNHFSLEEMLQFFATKYPNSDPGYVIRSLIYFYDAELQIDPVALNEITWTAVQALI